MAKVGCGQSRFWPKSVWPKSVGQSRFGQSRFRPKFWGGRGKEQISGGLSEGGLGNVVFSCEDCLGTKTKENKKKHDELFLFVDTRNCK